MNFQGLQIEYNKLISRFLSQLKPKPDILLVHDPQPAAALSFLSSRPELALWCCHIDTSAPIIFTAGEYAHNDFPPKNLVSFIKPFIDPLSSKNVLTDKGEAKRYIKRFGIDTNKYLITQIARLDPWKDPWR